MVFTLNLLYPTHFVPFCKWHRPGRDHVRRGAQATMPRWYTTRLGLCLLLYKQLVLAYLTYCLLSVTADVTKSCGPSTNDVGVRKKRHLDTLKIYPRSCGTERLRYTDNTLSRVDGCGRNACAFLSASPYMDLQVLTTKETQQQRGGKGIFAAIAVAELMLPQLLCHTCGTYDVKSLLETWVLA